MVIEGELRRQRVVLELRTGAHATGWEEERVEDDSSRPSEGREHSEARPFWFTMVVLCVENFWRSGTPVLLFEG